MCTSHSHVKPMPPWSWIERSSRTRRRPTRPPSPCARGGARRSGSCVDRAGGGVDRASGRGRRRSSCSTIGCFTAWKKPIGWSNCVRTRAYSAVVWSCHSAAPQRSAATMVRIAGSAASSAAAPLPGRGDDAGRVDAHVVERERRLVARQVDDAVGRDRDAGRVGGDGVEPDARRPRAPTTTKNAAFRASCTNGAVPSSTTPSPVGSRASTSRRGSHEPVGAVTASDAASPPAMRSSHGLRASARAASTDGRDQRRDRAATAAPTRPISSASAATAIIFMPTPPAASGTASAVQPSSTICCQSRLVPRAPAARRSRRRSWWSRATSARSFSIGAFSLAGTCAPSRAPSARRSRSRSPWAGPSCRPPSLLRLREAEDALAEDVALDLVAAGGDREAVRVQVRVRPAGRRRARRDRRGSGSRAGPRSRAPTAAMSCMSSLTSTFAWSGRRIGWSVSASTRMRRARLAHALGADRELRDLVADDRRRPTPACRRACVRFASATSARDALVERRRRRRCPRPRPRRARRGASSSRPSSPCRPRRRAACRARRRPRTAPR